MDNHNTFNPSVGANTFGPTSDYNGYGTDENGYDVEKNDLGPDYYNKQAHMGAEALYAAAEAEDIAKEEADEAAWNAEGEEKERNDKIHLALTGARDAIKEANARLDAIEAIIKEGEERAERMGIKAINNENATPAANAVDTPTMSTAESSDMTVGTAAVSATEARTDFSTANQQPITNEEAKDINKSPATASATDAKILPQDNLRYTGKDDIVYSDRQQAIDSFKN